MGVMKGMSHTIGQVSLSAFENDRQRRATAATITGARGVVQVGGPIPPSTPIGRLSDVEWGWIVAAVLFGWIQTRAEQAAADQLDTERTIRLTALDPEPWDAGAVAAILPDLANACEHVDWSKPLADWPRDTVIEFLLAAMLLIRKAMIGGQKCPTSTAPTSRSSPSTSPSTTRSSALQRPRPSSRGHTSARPSSGTNAHGAFSLTGSVHRR
jgi:hypothetical protein